ncbi:MAG: hypothetical protein MZV63_12925 [Marinilabiliales bacterium]|nr:hypothetical protein [Marinilabiliales bacterium]
MALSGAVASSEAGAPSEVKATSEPGGGYYLIVASFSDIDQAQQVADKYTNDYNADIIVLPPTPQGTTGSVTAVIPLRRRPAPHSNRQRNRQL